MPLQWQLIFFNFGPFYSSKIKNSLQTLENKDLYEVSSHTLIQLRVRANVYESTHITFFFKNSAVITCNIYTSTIRKSFFNIVIIQNRIKFIIFKHKKSIIKSILNFKRKFLKFLFESAMKDDLHFIFLDNL